VEQYQSYQALLQRNAARAAAGVVPSGIQLPFILVQTKPQATVEVGLKQSCGPMSSATYYTAEEIMRSYIIHKTLYRCSSRHPPHAVTVLATSSTT
jgi:hypothetical protein